MNEDCKYIVAIAECGSISKAASAAHISQPGMSQRLKRLETQLGANLFERGSLPLRPTAAGEVFLRYARQAMAQEDSMRREVRTMANQGVTRLRIGVSMARANSMLANVIVSFYETHRGCTLELVEMNTMERMHRLFLGNEIDFAVLTPIAPDPTSYYMEVLGHEHLVVVAAEGSNAPQLARAKAGTIGLRQLEGLPLVLPTCGDFFDPLVDRAIDLSHAQLDVVMRDCSVNLALQVACQGLGIAIVPSSCLVNVTGLQSWRLSDVQARAVLRYIRRGDRLLSDEEALFMSILHDYLRQMG